MSRVYLDLCCFNRPFDDQVQARIKLETEAKLEVQDRVRDGRLELVWSPMLDLENAAHPIPERRGQIGLWRNLAARTVEMSPELETRAETFATEGFKAADSLHISCAIGAGCDFFLTTDDGVLKKRDRVQEIRILNPVEFILEVE